MSCNHTPKPLSRRQALSMVGGGMGMVALSNMVSSSLQAATPRDGGHERGASAVALQAAGQAHHLPVHERRRFARRYFRHKPMLEKYNGKPAPEGNVLTARKTGNLMMSPFKFKKYGDSGLQVSELWPNVGGIADDICMINSMYSEIPNHEPCITLMNTGSNIIGRPSMGAWITYGLGLENQNLPGYVVLCPSQPITIGSPLWSAGFLPAMHQGTYVKNEWIEGEPFQAAKVIPNVTNSAVSEAVQKNNVSFLRKLNELNMEAVGKAGLATGRHH